MTLSKSPRKLDRPGRPRWTARSQKILAVDAPRPTQHALAPAFDKLLADLGITGTDDLIARCRSVADSLPSVWETAEAIVAANREVFVAP